MTKKAGTIVVKLPTRTEKKHSVRFDTDLEGEPVSTIYVRKSALEKIGNPDKIKVTIEAA